MHRPLKHHSREDRGGGKHRIIKDRADREESSERGATPCVSNEKKPPQDARDLLERDSCTTTEGRVFGKEVQAAMEGEGSPYRQFREARLTSTGKGGKMPIREIAMSGPAIGKVEIARR